MEPFTMAMLGVTARYLHKRFGQVKPKCQECGTPATQQLRCCDRTLCDRHLHWWGQVGGKQCVYCGYTHN
jgi:hypothetical protein